MLDDANRIDQKKHNHNEGCHQNGEKNDDNQPFLFGDNDESPQKEQYKKCEPNGVAELTRLFAEREQKYRAKHDRRYEQPHDSP